MRRAVGPIVTLGGLIGAAIAGFPLLLGDGEADVLIGAVVLATALAVVAVGAILAIGAGARAVRWTVGILLCAMLAALAVVVPAAALAD